MPPANSKDGSGLAKRYCSASRSITSAAIPGAAWRSPRPHCLVLAHRARLTLSVLTARIAKARRIAAGLSTNRTGRKSWVFASDRHNLERQGEGEGGDEKCGEVARNIGHDNSPRNDVDLSIEALLENLVDQVTMI
jgi:hypothetical protein